MTLAETIEFPLPPGFFVAGRHVGFGSSLSKIKGIEAAKPETMEPTSKLNEADAAAGDGHTSSARTPLGTAGRASARTRARADLRARARARRREAAAAASASGARQDGANGSNPEVGEHTLDDVHSTGAESGEG